MSQFFTEKLNENENSESKVVKLNNQDVSVNEFNRTLESLKPNQRILETSDRNFHIVERIQG